MKTLTILHRNARRRTVGDNVDEVLVFTPKSSRIQRAGLGAVWARDPVSGELTCVWGVDDASADNGERPGWRAAA